MTRIYRVPPWASPPRHRAIAATTVIAAITAVMTMIAPTTAGVPRHGHAGRCLSAPVPIYHPYNRAGNDAWRMTLSFVPRCAR